MKITISQFNGEVTFSMEGMSVEQMRELAEDKERFAKIMTDANDAAELVWKKFPQYAAITFDTNSQEEREMLENARRREGGLS